MPNEASVQLSAVDRTLLLGLKRLVAVTVEKPDAETYLSPLMDMIYELVEDIAENATKQDLDQGGAALDCKMGCAHCCNVYDVDTTAFELFRIIDFVSENFTPERIEELNAEIAEQNIFKQRAGEKNWLSFVRPCPFLQDGACSIHPVRPFVCRSVSSYAVAQCEAVMLAPGKGRTILGSAYHQQLYLLAREYLREACKDASLDHEVLLLAGAMSLVGGIPNAKGQWLQGEPVLREAINNLPAV